MERFDEHYGCYRLPAREAEAEMVSSLRQFGQLSPVVCRWQEETPSLIDGFRRLHAARQIAGLGGLTMRLIEIDDREAKVAMYRLNLVGRRVHVLEAAWLVCALVREDGLSQLEVAQLMGRHKSWVCRRLALLEKLAPPVRQDLQMGLLSPTAARSLTQLPAGNQEEVLEAVRRESLTAAEVREVVDLLLASSTREKKGIRAGKPRQALSQARGGPTRSWDPRLSTAGNRVARKLGGLLDYLAGMENWLRHRGRGELSLCDVGILSPGFERLARDSRVVGELAGDLVQEMKFRHIDLPDRVGCVLDTLSDRRGIIRTSRGTPRRSHDVTTRNQTSDYRSLHRLCSFHLAVCDFGVRRLVAALDLCTPGCLATIPLAA